MKLLPKQKLIRQVKKLPKKPVEGEIIYNRGDGLFYMGVNIKGEELGSSLEKTSLCE